jgi:hypothetical protein
MEFLILLGAKTQVNQEWIFEETVWHSKTLVIALIPQWIPSIKLNIKNAGGNSKLHNWWSQIIRVAYKSDFLVFEQ